MIKKLLKSLKETLNEEWLYDGSGVIEFEVPSEIIDSICTQGSNDVAVEEVCAGILRKQLDEISTEDINYVFKEYGFDMPAEEKARLSRQEKEHYIVWALCWDAFDRRAEELPESFDALHEGYPKKSVRKEIDAEDDLVKVFNGEEEIYAGLEDYEPMKDENWKWDSNEKCYVLDNYKKFCYESLNETSDELVNAVSLARKRNSIKAHDDFRHVDDMVTAEKEEVYKKYIGKPNKQAELNSEIAQINAKYDELIKELSDKSVEADKKLERNKELVAKRNARLSKNESLHSGDVAIFNAPDTELYEVSAVIRKYGNGKYYINFQDRKNGEGNTISTAGAYETEKEAMDAMKRLRPDYVLVDFLDKHFDDYKIIVKNVYGNNGIIKHAQDLKLAKQIKFDLENKYKDSKVFIIDKNDEVINEALNEISDETIRSSLYKQAEKGVNAYYDSDDFDTWSEWGDKFRKNLNNYRRIFDKILKTKTRAEKEEFMKQYRKNENGNYHFENLLLTAEFVEDKELIKAAKSLLNKYRKQGSYRGGDEISRAKMKIDYILKPVFDSVYDDLHENLKEEYDKSNFQFCVNTGDIKLLEKLIDEKIAEYDTLEKAPSKERDEIVSAVEDMLNRLASSGEDKIKEEDFNRLYDKLNELNERIIDDNTVMWNKAEKEQKERLAKFQKMLNNESVNEGYGDELTYEEIEALAEKFDCRGKSPRQAANLCIKYIRKAINDRKHDRWSYFNTYIWDGFAENGEEISEACCKAIIREAKKDSNFNYYITHVFDRYMPVENVLNVLKEHTNESVNEEEKREVLPIKFVGVDEWNRPAFKPVDKTKKYYLTDVNNLFSENATEEEIKKFYADKKPLRDFITYHGYSLDDDPMGSKLKFDLEII